MSGAVFGSGIFAFGVGAAKTGTHSLAALFEDRRRAAHEPEAESLMRLTLARATGHLTEAEFATCVDAQFRRLDLELNVSQINGFIVQTLAALYPDAAYVLTLRDGESWVRSFVNHQRTRGLPQGSAWQAFRNLRFQPQHHPYTVNDTPLANNGLYSLDAYLSYWLRHNADVIRSVRADRLFVAPTDQIAREAESIAHFIGADPADVNAEKSHDYAGDYVHNPLDDMNPDYLRARITAYTDHLRGEVRPLLSGRAARLFEEALMPRAAAAGPAQPATDLARWSNPENLSDRWRYRSELAARFIPAGATLLDIGCGKMAIESLLPPGCRYIPADVVARDSRTIVCDLNKGEFPPVSGVTHISMLGVLEYAFDPHSVWRRLAESRARIVMSYIVLRAAFPVPKRIAMGWVNHLTRADLLTFAEANSYALNAEQPISADNTLFVFDPV